MGDYIDRTAAIVQACKQIKDDYLAFDVKEAIKKIPSAVVRCRDCKYNMDNPRNWEDNDLVESYYWCEFLAENNGFCSYGARMDGDPDA